MDDNNKKKKLLAFLAFLVILLALLFCLKSFNKKPDVPDVPTTSEKKSEVSTEPISSTEPTETTTVAEETTRKKVTYKKKKVTTTAELKTTTTTKPTTTRPVTTKPFTTAPVTTTEPVTTAPVTTTEPSTTEPPTTEPETTTAPVTTTEPTTAVEARAERYTGFESDMLTSLNSHRTQNGRTALTNSPALNEAAAKRAEELVSGFSHTRPNGTNFITVLEEDDITYTSATENIAMYGNCITPDISIAMNIWRESAGHNANMLDRNKTQVGFGCYLKGKTAYWVQIFIE